MTDKAYFAHNTSKSYYFLMRKHCFIIFLSLFAASHHFAYCQSPSKVPIEKKLSDSDITLFQTLQLSYNSQKYFEVVEHIMSYPSLPKQHLSEITSLLSTSLSHISKKPKTEVDIVELLKKLKHLKKQKHYPSLIENSFKQSLSELELRYLTLLISKNHHKKDSQITERLLHNVKNLIENQSNLEWPEELFEIQLKFCEKHHTDAVLLFREHKLDQAIEIWDRILMLNKDYAPAIIFKKRALYLKEKLDKLKH